MRFPRLRRGSAVGIAAIAAITLATATACGG